MGQPTKLAIELGKRIRMLRKQRSWRQIDLAAHAEISKTHISDIEVARAEICLGTLERIAQALEVSPADLLR